MKYNQEDREIIRRAPGSYFALGYALEVSRHRLYKELGKVIKPVIRFIDKLW